MSKVIELPDETYQALVDAANKRHETPEEMLNSLARALTSPREQSITASMRCSTRSTHTRLRVMPPKTATPMPTNEHA